MHNSTVAKQIQQTTKVYAEIEYAFLPIDKNHIHLSVAKILNLFGTYIIPY